jgi:predicted amidohydrolase YtcJ
VHHLFSAFARVGGADDRARLRWSVAHLHDAGPPTMIALQKLGLGWLTQNAIYFAAPAFIRNLPAARRASAPPIGSALRAGLKVAGGTDAAWKRARLKEARGSRSRRTSVGGLRPACSPISRCSTRIT